MNLSCHFFFPKNKQSLICRLSAATAVLHHTTVPVDLAFDAGCSPSMSYAVKPQNTG